MASITGFYLGLLGVIYLVLSLLVVGYRWKYRMAIGDGDHVELRKVIRIHANFIEYVPIVLLMMLCLENAGHSSRQVELLGIALVVARICHAVGVFRTTGTSLLRTVGVLATFAVLAVGSFWLLV